MISSSRHAEALELERQTGWSIKPEGACKDDRCVPLGLSTTSGGRVDLAALAERLGMALVYDAAQAVWCLGPESGGQALSSAHAPELVLPDIDGEPFRLSSLRGTKVLLVAWASW
jgi:hypothetical protein